jgi:serine/threonine protein kinase
MKISGLQNTDPIVHFCYIQMELCSKSLDQWLKEKSLRDTIESINIFKQIVQGLAFMHKNNLVHRDIKPSNILFAITDDGDHCVRITDFGLARSVDQFTTSVAGSPLYMAPETHTGLLDTKSDMYSAGLILIELLTNCSDDVKGKLEYAKIDIFPKPFEEEVAFALPTVRNLLSEDPSVRPSSEDLLNIISKWVRPNYTFSRLF